MKPTLYDHPSKFISMLFCLASCMSFIPAQAQTNLLNNAVLAATGGARTLPTGWSHQGWVPDGAISHQMGPCPNVYLCAAYGYGKDADGQAYMDLSLSNSSKLTAYTNLFLNGQISVPAGKNYRVAVIGKIVDLTGQASTDVGFHLYDAAGYIGERSAEYTQSLGVTETNMMYYYQSGFPVPDTTRTPTRIQPRLSIYLAPQAKLRIRLKAPWLSEGLGLSSVGIDARTGLPRRMSAAPGKILKFTAGLHGRLSTSSTAYVTLVSTSGGGSQRFSHAVSSADPRLPDAWQIKLPSTMPTGEYSIRYDVRDTTSGMQRILQPEADVVTVTERSGSKTYEIGRLDVTSQAGIAVGQHFHGHPGTTGGESRGTDPILVPYHFVRSHDSSNVIGNSWWIEDTVNHSADGAFNWTEFDRWANFHAANGQKKLLITFYGSPTWASSKPKETSPYGIPGLSAPPANLASYQKMVKATVSRYSGRIFATECWNEPLAHPSDFFTGSGTQLADICKAIYISTKAVDSNIPVICPANNDFNWLLSLKTSQGEPIHQFCDWVNAHPYNSTGTDLTGFGYSLDSLGGFIESQEQKLKLLGLQKPISITEWGMMCDDRPAAAHPTHFHSMDSQSRGDLLYQTIATAKEKGVVALGLYSYDSGDVPGATGGAPACRYGYEGIGLRDAATGRFTYDAVTAKNVTNAVRDFGKPLP